MPISIFLVKQRDLLILRVDTSSILNKETINNTKKIVVDPKSERMGRANAESYVTGKIIVYA